MTKNTRKPRHNPRTTEKKTTREHKTASVYYTRIKDLSKKFIHDYVLPMTRTLEHRLQRFEQSL